MGDTPKSTDPAFVVNEGELCEWLKKCGILCDHNKVRRVIVDLQIGNRAAVYLETYGKRAIFDVPPPDLSGADVAPTGRSTE